jgi:superfamily II DNA or RNA helicase
MEVKPIKIWVKDGLFVKSKSIDPETKDKLINRFTKDFYKKEKVCENCEYYDQRPCDVCDSCPNYGGRVKLAREVIIKDKKYLRMPFGGLEAVRKRVGKLKVVDRTTSPEMRRPIKFVRELRPDQIKARDAIIRAKSGILKSPPRSGKTVISSAAICELGLKTLIIASQKEWLDNFLETFIGSNTEKAFTDASPKRVGIVKKPEDFEKYDVALVTYQKFLSAKGRKLLHKIRKMFGVLIVDEIQGGNAKEYASVLNTFHCEYRIGLSGTPERKDNRHWVLDQLFGPVFYDNKVERMVPEVTTIRTDFHGPVPQSWTSMVRKIEFDPKRLKLIAETALKDMHAGHLVLIPMARVDAINALSKAINIIEGKKVSRPFHGRLDKETRRETIERARNYKTKIVVGNINLLSTGINIPRASALYEVTPSSNLPKAEQRFSRVLTPYEGKPRPIFRYFLDDFDLRRNCIRTEFFGKVWPTFRPIINPKVKERFFDYLQERSSKGRKSRTKRVMKHTGGIL